MRDDDSVARVESVIAQAIDTEQWREARQAVTALRASLRLAGLEREVPHLRADLNPFAQGYAEWAAWPRTSRNSCVVARGPVIEVDAPVVLPMKQFC